MYLVVITTRMSRLAGFPRLSLMERRKDVQLKYERHYSQSVYLIQYNTSIKLTRIGKPSAWSEVAQYIYFAPSGDVVC
jgi:hypothetical protein